MRLKIRPSDLNGRILDQFFPFLSQEIVSSQCFCSFLNIYKTKLIKRDFELLDMLSPSKTYLKSHSSCMLHTSWLISVGFPPEVAVQ